MSEMERMREPVSSLPSSEVLRAKAREGWRPVAIEWVRDEKPADGAEPAVKRPIPYGLRISADCTFLEVDPTEKEVMSLIIAMIAGDHPLSKIAGELNQRDLRARDGARWSQVAIFKLLPRIVEFGPEILSHEAWTASKRRVLAEVS